MGGQPTETTWEEYAEQGTPKPQPTTEPEEVQNINEVVPESVTTDTQPLNETISTR